LAVVKVVLGLAGANGRLWDGGRRAERDTIGALRAGTAPSFPKR
jgi:hypothetical protein